MLVGLYSYLLKPVKYDMIKVGNYCFKNRRKCGNGKEKIYNEIRFYQYY